MAERDPAFLYYDADVALDVQHMNRQERGCYFDLIQMYRRYRGYTMEQLRKILGIDMESCWNSLELVLEFDDVTGKYHIPWLRAALAKRAQGSEIQRERIKKYWDGVRKAEAEALAKGEPLEKRRKKRGNTADIPRNNQSNTMDIPLENENENKNRIEDDVGGPGEEEGEREGDSTADPPIWKEGDWSHLPPTATKLPAEMVEIFVRTFPGYPRQEEKDLAACLQIAYNIADMNGWTWQSALNGRLADVLEKWSEIVVFVNGNQWFRTKSLSFLNDKFQDLIQNKNNGTNRTKSSVGRSAGTIELINQLGADLATGRSTDIPG